MNMTFTEFIKHIKKQRLTGSWYTFVGNVEGKNVQLKGYKTWLQIYHVDGIQYGNCCDRNVACFNHDLAAPFR